MTISDQYRIVPPPRFAPEDWDETQRRVLTHQGAPLLVIGGPGTGKTSVLAQAVAQRLDAGQKVLVIAANRLRVSTLRNDIALRADKVTSPDAVTFHGLGWALVQRFWPEAEPPRLLTAPEQEARLRALLDERGLAAWPSELRLAVETAGFVRQLRAVVARLRQFDLNPQEIAQENGLPEWAALAEFFQAYVARLEEQRELDYPELAHRARALISDPAVAAVLSREYDAIFVDDFADCEPIHVSLLQSLLPASNTLLVFADPQQAINTFRGTTSDAVVDFRDSFPGAETLILKRNYRSASALAQVGQAVAQKLGFAAKSLIQTRYWETESMATPGAVHCWSAPSVEELAVAVAAAIRDEHLREGRPWGEIAILYPRPGRIMGLLVKELAANRIPISVAGDEIPLAENGAVLLLLNVLRQAVSGLDVDSIATLAVSPLGGLDPVGWRKVLRRLDRDGLTLADYCANPTEKTGVLGVVTRLVRLIEGLAQRVPDTPVDGLLDEIWNSTSWPQRLREASLAGESRSADRDLDALCSLFAVAGRISPPPGPETVHRFIAEILDQEIPADHTRESRFSLPGVQLSTVYRAAGSQWSSVYLLGLVEGEWPLDRDESSIFSIDRLTSAGWVASPITGGSIAAEQRLFYAGVSRARERLVLGGLNNGADIWESRFLTGLRLDLVRPPVASFLTSGESLTIELRRALADESRTPAVREQAALALNRLAAIPGRSGPSFPEANPDNWWAVAPLSTSGSMGKGLTEIQLSGSSLESLLSCPRKYFLERYLFVEGAKKPSLVVGSLLHHICERASLADGVDWGQVLAELWPTDIFPSGYDSRWQLLSAQAAIQRYLVWHEMRTNPDYVPGVAKAASVTFEVPFNFTMMVDDLTVRFRGRIDRLEVVEENPWVFDLKSGTPHHTLAELKTHAQLGVYQLAIREGALNEALGLPAQTRPAPGGAALVFVGQPDLRGTNNLVKQGLLPGGVQLPKLLVQKSLTEEPFPDPGESEGVSWIDAAVRKAVKIMQDGSFPATPSEKACQYCRARSSCPAVEDGGQLL